MAATALVTGCSSGIGRATAERFDDAGWEVYATARDPDEIRDLGERGCRTVELDVTETSAAQSAVDRVVSESGRIDCLVNNAGYGQLGAVEDVPLAGVREQFSDTPVEVVLVEPGIVATDFYDRAVEELASIDHSPSYADLYRVLDDIQVVERGGPGINRPERVAETILEAATVDRPDAVYRVGSITRVGTLAGGVVRGRVRDSLSRTALRGLASDPVQHFLER